MMARRCVLPPILAGLGAVPSPPAAAQITAEEALANAQASYSAVPREEACPQADPGTIVVCRRKVDPDSLRVRSENGRAGDGRADRGDVPDAPYVYGGFMGGITVARGCFVPPCPRPAAVLIDLAAIPEALTPEQAAAVRRADPPAQP